MSFFWKAILIRVSILLLGQPLFAQIIEINTNSRDLNICGLADTFMVSLQNNNSVQISGVEVLIVLPTGIEYVSGSVIGNGIFELGNPSPDSAIFGSANIPPAQGIDFSFLLKATCSATDSLPLFNSIAVNHNLGVDTAQSLPFALLRPSLALLSVVPTFGISNNDTVYRQCVSVTNGGLGALNNFSLLCEGEAGLFAFDNFNLGPNGSSLSTTVLGDSTWITIDSNELVTLGNMDHLFSENELAIICFDVIPQSCNGGNYELKTSWGCGEETCEEQKFNSSALVTANHADLIYSHIENSDDNCRGNGRSMVKIVVENIGTDTAEGITFFIQANNPRNFAWDTSSAVIFDTIGGSSPLSFTAVNLDTLGRVMDCYNGPLIESFGINLPDMAPGNRDTLRIEYADCCIEGCHANPHTAQFGFSIESRLRWRDECDTILEVRDARVFSRHSSVLGEPIFSGPTDLLAGDTGVYCMTINQLTLWGAGPGSYLDLQLTAPNGLSFPNGVYFEDESGTQWHPSAYLSQGDTTNFQFSLPFPNGYSTRTQTLKIPLTGDCTNDCGGESIVNINFRLVVDSSCTCPQSFFCMDWDVNLHCSNCTCYPAGLVFTNLEARRLNYGLPDNNNDGQPDSNGTLDFSKVASDLLIFGDTLGIKLFGVVDTSGTDSFFTKGYARSFIPDGNLLQPIHHSLEVVDFSTGMSQTIPISIPDTSFSVNNLGNGLFYQYAFDTSGLGGLGNGYVFEDGDSLILDTRYKVTTNVGLNLEGGKMEHHYGLLEMDGDTVGCDTFAGTIKVIGYAWRVPPSILGSPVCRTEAIQWMGLRIGPPSMGLNVFNHEFRHFGYPDSMTHVLPQGFRPTYGSNPKAQIQFHSEFGSGTTLAWTTDSINTVLSGNVLKVALGNLFAVNGGPWELKDEEFLMRIRLNYDIECEFRDTTLPGLVEFKYNTIPAFSGPGADSVIQTENTNWQIYNVLYGFNTSLASIAGTSKTIAWNFEAFLAPQINHTYLQGWVQIQSPSGQIVNPVLTPSGSSIPIISQGSWLPLGNLPPNQQLDFDLKAEYQQCGLDSILLLFAWSCEPRDSLTPFDICAYDSLWLWVDPQPSELQGNVSLSNSAIDACDSLVMEVDLRSVQLADVNNIGLKIVLPGGGGLDYIQGSTEMKFPLSGNYAGVSDPLISGNQLFWNINSINPLLANGIKGVGTPDSNHCKLRFSLESNCNFVSGQQILLEVFGNRPCGEALPPIRLLTDPITINGAPQPYTTNINASLTPQSDCPHYSTFNVSIANNGPGNFSTGDSISVDLPTGYQYAGNSVPISNAPTSPPNIQNISGGLRLSWPCPTGLPPNGLVEFTFDIEAPGNLGCRFDFFPVTSKVNSNMFCDRTNSNCSIGIQTGSVLVSNTVSLPDISFQTLSGTRNTVGLDREYLFTGTLANTGLPVPPGDTVWVEYYCDSNQDAVFSTGDILLGSHAVSTGIPSNGVANFGGMITFPANSCGDNNSIIGVVHPDPTQGFCFCDSTQALFNPPLSESAILAEAEALPKGNLVSWRVKSLNEFEVFWIESLLNGDWIAVPATVEFAGQKGQLLDQQPHDLSNYRVVGRGWDGHQITSNLVQVQRTRPVGYEVFPNPNTGLFNVKGVPGAAVHVYDVYSKCVLTGVLDGNGKGKFSLEKFPAGVYLLMMKVEGVVHMEKVVRSR